MENSTIVNAVIACIAGASSGYFAPWLAWRFEKQRDLRVYRRSLVQEWRTKLLNRKTLFAETFSSSNEGIRLIHAQPTSQQIAQRLVNHPAFASLEHHLSSKFNEELESLLGSNALIIDIGDDSNTRSPVETILSEEISRIEKTWQLV